MPLVIKPGVSPKLSRAARALLIAVAGQFLLVIGHFLYGVHHYQDTGRLHVVVPAVVSMILASALTVLLLRWPGRLLSLVLAAVVAVPFVGMFGFFHGAYGHLLKCVLYFHGASTETLENLFMSPDFTVPDDVLFEVTGIATFAVAILVGVRLAKLLGTVWRGPSAADAPGDGQGRKSFPGLGPAETGGTSR